MNATNAALVWNPGTAQVAVVPWPIKNRDDRAYSMSTLAPFAHVRKLSFNRRKLFVFMEAVHLIVRDKCDPIAVHRALLNLDEYRSGLSYDMPGYDGQ